jgi:hypothetical protein
LDVEGSDAGEPWPVVLLGEVPELGELPLWNSPLVPLSSEGLSLEPGESLPLRSSGVDWAWAAESPLLAARLTPPSASSARPATTVRAISLLRKKFTPVA